MVAPASSRPRWLRPLALVAVLAGCGPWPDLGVDDGEVTDWGRLAPSAALDAATVLPEDSLEDEAEASAQLEARAEALARRAETVGLSPEDRAEFDALMRALEARDG